MKTGFVRFARFMCWLSALAMLGLIIAIFAGAITPGMEKIAWGVVVMLGAMTLMNISTYYFNPRVK